MGDVQPTNLQRPVFHRFSLIQALLGQQRKVFDQSTRIVMTNPLKPTQLTKSDLNLLDPSLQVGAVDGRGYEFAFQRGVCFEDRQQFRVKVGRHRPAARGTRPRTLRRDRTWAGMI